MGFSLQPGRQLAWENRFQEPSPEDLGSHYNKQVRNLIESARERLSGFEGVEEVVSWEGLPWRWTMKFRLPNDPTRAWAYLVPHPEGPQLAVPLTGEMIESLPLRRMKKHVRDGVAFGTRVDNVLWATWDIQTKSHLDDVLDVAKRKHKFIEKA
jgi:hypothetical protein